MPDILSTRNIADRFGVPLSSVVRAVERLGLGQRVGRNRAVKLADLPQIETALKAMGYLHPASPIRPAELRITPPPAAPPAGPSSPWPPCLPRCATPIARPAWAPP
jgi:hypothetical protein